MDYSLLPRVDRVAEEAGALLAGAGTPCPRQALVQAARTAVEQLRTAGIPAGADRADLLRRAAEDAAARCLVGARSGLRRVLNATGVVLHTNLGRAPLAPAALRAVGEAAGYCNLELDLEEGRRGGRHARLTALLQSLTGAEAALVVNNNAAAVLLALDTLARGGEAVVSRGQLVEIGGGFRIPEVVARSGAVLREVGTTNKTRLADYRRAIRSKTACLLQVHPSNYRITGFTESVPTARLAGLAHDHGLPLICDLGSGCLRPPAVPGAEGEPRIAQVLREGADVLAFSGDKLLGGPQAGILVGKRRYLDRMGENPLFRALRVDKLTLAALEATLALYRDGRAEEIPALAMLNAPEEALRARAGALRDALSGCPARLSLTRRRAPAGGGALPEVFLPAWVVEIRPGDGDTAGLLRRLRTGDPAVLGYIRADRACFDVRTLTEAEAEEAARAIRAALA